jgi:hypothetical protein
VEYNVRYGKSLTKKSTTISSFCTHLARLPRLARQNHHSARSIKSLHLFLQ